MEGMSKARLRKPSASSDRWSAKPSPTPSQAPSLRWRRLAVQGASVVYASMNKKPGHRSWTLDWLQDTDLRAPDGRCGTPLKTSAAQRFWQASCKPVPGSVMLPGRGGSVLDRRPDLGVFGDL